MRSTNDEWNFQNLFDERSGVLFDVFQRFGQFRTRVGKHHDVWTWERSFVNHAKHGR